MSAISDLQVLRAACCVAGANGHVGEAERRVIGRLAEKAGVGAASLAAMIEMAETDPEFHKNQLGVLRKDPALALQRLYITAAADGQITPEEQHLLEHFARQLGFTDQQLAEEFENARTRLAEHRRGGA